MYISVKFLTLHIINHRLIKGVTYVLSRTKDVSYFLISIVLYQITNLARKRVHFLLTELTDNYHHYRFLFFKRRKKYINNEFRGMVEKVGCYRVVRQDS